MDFEWDDTKAESNFFKHGIPFVEAIGVFADVRIVVVETVRIEDGEQRQKAIGQIDGRLFTVVVTDAGRRLPAYLGSAIERDRGAD